MQTYPEKTTFRWEEKPRLSMDTAFALLIKSRKQTGSPQRKASYVAVIHALEHIQHEHDPASISSAKLKELLIIAAQEHGWYAQDMRAVRASAGPMPFAPPGSKACRKCREVKPTEDFLASVSSARARTYGWSEDTTQKRVAHLCTPCRKANQQAQARKNARSSVKNTFHPEMLRNNPELAARVSKYQTLVNQLRTQADRTRAAFTNARKSLEIPGEGVVYEYQFKTDALRQFYESKRVYLQAAKHRLEIKFGETTPLPTAWGMLLTQEEQRELAELHAEAVLSCPSNRIPSLWKDESQQEKK